MPSLPQDIITLVHRWMMLVSPHYHTGVSYVFKPQSIFLGLKLHKQLSEYNKVICKWVWGGGASNYR